MESPQCFIELVDGSLILNEELAQKFSGCDSPVQVIGIVGKQKTGKSYLMSQFLDSEAGFEVGHSFVPQTKGVWLYARVHPLYPDIMLVLLDTEGLDQPGMDPLDEARILTLTTLLSSVLLYNIMGSVSRSALEEIDTAVCQVSKLVEKTEDQERIHDLLCLTMRDFNLDNEDHTSYTLGLMKDDQKKHISSVFHDVLVQGLPVPTSAEKLKQLPNVETKDTFQVTLKEFMGKVRDEPILKTSGETSFFTASNFVEIVRTYVDALNKKQAINCSVALKTMAARCLDEAARRAADVYKKRIQSLTQTLPMEEKELGRVFSLAEQEAHVAFAQCLQSLSEHVDDMWWAKMKQYKSSLETIKAQKEVENRAAYEQTMTSPKQNYSQLLFGERVAEHEDVDEDVKEIIFHVKDPGPAQCALGSVMLPEQMTPLKGAGRSSVPEEPVNVPQPEQEEKWYKKLWKYIVSAFKSFFGKIMNILKLISSTCKCSAEIEIAYCRNRRYSHSRMAVMTHTMAAMQEHIESTDPVSFKFGAKFNYNT